MSKPRYDWWPYVKGMIRRYPALQAEYADPQALAGNGPRDMARLAIRELPGTRRREYEAVRRAVEATERYANGPDRLKIVDLVLWKQSRTIEGAAMTVPCAPATAWRWHGDFIRLVARFYGLMDE